MVAGGQKTVGKAGARAGWPMVASLALVAALGACGNRQVILEGERFDTRAPLDASIQLQGEPPPVDTTGVIVNRALPISLPAMTSPADWTHRGGNTRHLAPHVSLSAAPARVWSLNIGSGDSRAHRITTQPVVGGGRVFAMDARTNVTAATLAGVAAWSADLRPDGARTNVSGGGLAYADGRLYAATGYGEVVAVDATTGGVIWRQKLGSPAAGAPMVEAGVVYVVARDSSAWAIDVTNGRVIWELPGTPSPSGMIGAASPAVAGQLVLLPYASGEVTAATRREGVRQWSATVAGQRRGRAYARLSEITGDPVVAGNVTYIGNQSGRTVAISSDTGARLWTAREGAYGPVAPAGNSVFLVSDEARLVRLDAASGETVWSVEMPYFTTDRERRRRAITAHYGPVLVGGRVAVASGDGVLRLFNPVDGALVGTIALPGGAAAAPAFAQGLMFVVTQNGQLHAFR